MVVTAEPPSAPRATLDLLIRKIESREATVAMIGLGFAGFPQGIEIARAGLMVTGIDVDAGKVSKIAAGESLSPDVPRELLRELQAAGFFSCSTDYAAVRGADIVVVCVPTPLDSVHRPDLQFVQAVADRLRHGVRAGQLLVVESTVPPGTTRKLFEPVLEGAGLRLGEDAFLAFAPERIDPGNRWFPLERIPRLVGGVTQSCTRVAARFYESFVREVVPVSSPEIAEMAKGVENSFRFINISFVNEVAMLCDRMGISVWEVIQASSTKPFAFMPHHPGPGVGGHCIPIVPFYLESVAREHGVAAEMIEAAGRVNARMPGFVVDKLERELLARGAVLAGARVLVVGVTYKPDVPDLREAAGPRILALLEERGARVSYYDPYVPELRLSDRALRSQPELGAEGADCAVLVTPHKGLDYGRLAEARALVLDTVNALPRGFPGEIVKL